MSEERDMLVEITTEHPYEKNYISAALFLPASKAQLEDAMQQARAIKRETFMDIRVHTCQGLSELAGTRLESPTLDELNYFAYRLSVLDERDIVALNAIFGQRKETGRYDDVGVSMKELINLTYGLSDIPVIGGVDTDEKLGEFVLNNDMDETFRYLNKELIPILNKKKIGRDFRKEENGVFFEGCYISSGGYVEQNVYDGEKYPEEMPVEYGEGIVLLQVGRPATPELQDVSKWIALPINKEAADEVAREMGAQRIEDCVYFDMKSSIPYVNETAFDDTEKFDILNKVAASYVAMDVPNRIKFKAIISSIVTDDLDKMLEIVENMSEFEHSYYSNHTANYGAEYLARVLQAEADMDLFDNETKQRIGKSLLCKTSSVMTEYGAVSQRGASLFQTNQKEELRQDEEQGIGEMKM